MKFVTFNIRYDCGADGENNFCFRKPFILQKIREEQPEITADEIREFLGEPRDVARMFLDTLDPVRVERYRKRKKWFIRLLIGVLTVALCGALYAAYYFLTTPQCIYEQVTYIYESREASPDDPKAVNPYQ